MCAILAGISARIGFWVPRLYDETDLRLSYVIWQEGVDPVVVELLSPGTEEEDLGENVRSEDSFKFLLRNRTKLKVGEETGEMTKQPSEGMYERILRVPYYVVFSRYTNRLRRLL